jgi:branched-chain amino acid transport system ATP-binding protein
MGEYQVLENEMRTEAPILSVEKVSKNFGGLAALNDINLSVRLGEIFGLIGPNGAGKTTLFNLLSGALRPDSGRIVFGEDNITRFKADRRSRLGIGRTFQIAQPFLELTVEENVMTGAITRHIRIKHMREEIQEYIDLVGLTDKRNSPAKQLSTGQRKRLELARALATHPKLMLLDEVTGGVDHASIPVLMELVLRLRDRGVTLLIIEHNVRVISELADRIMFLNRGEKLAEGSPDEISRHPDVVNLYLGSSVA